MIIKLKKIGFDSNKKNNGTEELMDSIAENKKKVISVGIILATVIAGIFLLMANLLVYPRNKLISSAEVYRKKLQARSFFL